MRISFIDAGVLIAAVRGTPELVARAREVLGDPEISFASSVFVRLEVLPKASFYGREMEAASKLSELLRGAAQGPMVIHNCGKDLVVVLAVEDYERLTAFQQPPRAGGAAFLQRVEALKRRHGGGVSDFEPAHLDFVPTEPFARKRTGRG